MSDEELRTSRLPSGWTPLELVKHLVYMERRWLRWGFLAEQVPQPWGDEQDDRWHVGPDETAADLIAAMHDGGRRTREIVTNADLSDEPRSAGASRKAIRRRRSPGSRARVRGVRPPRRPPGHCRELADGATGE